MIFKTEKRTYNRNANVEVNMNISLIEPLGVSDEVIRELSRPLVNRGHNFSYYSEKTSDLEELKRRSDGQDIVMIANGKYPDEVVEASNELKMLAVAFTGIDHVGLKACKEKHITVCNCAGYSNTCVAEQVIGMTISLYRKLLECDEAVREGKTSTGLIGQEINGKKVGIIGCGQIGAMTARLFLAFGADVYAFARNERDNVKAMGVKYLPLDELLKTCDIISLHTPNNSSTKGMIGKKEFSLMKPESVFINCARGPIVDNEALAEALNEGKIAGAAIDVFDMEPPIPSDYPLLNCKNILLAPHVAFYTKEAMFRRARIEFDNVIKYVDGKPENICTF